MIRGWRWLAALALGVALGLGLVAPASAAPAQPADIDAAARGSITIDLAVVDGPVPPEGSTIFELLSVSGVDLTTADGWAEAILLSDDVLGIPSDRLGAPVTATSDAAGLVQFTDLPVGLYLLRQTSGPGILVPTMLVPVPTQDLDNEGEWLYDVALVAKAEPVPVNKQVADGNAGVDGEDASVAGQVLTYTFDTGIPADGLRGFGGACLRDGITDRGAGLDAAGFNSQGRCAAGAQWSGLDDGAGYRLVDDLSMTVPGTVRPSSDFLAWTTDSFNGEITVQLQATALVACAEGELTDCDYVVTKSASTLQLDLTDQGMVKMADARAADSAASLVTTAQAVVLDTVTEITAVSDSVATAPFVLRLPNKLLVFPSGSAIEYGLPAESPVTQTIYATLQLHKVTVDGEDLSGAVFTLYRTLADAQADRNALAVSAPTNAAGMTQFAGLHVTDFQNNANDDDSYWVVETGVPAGYVGVSGAFEVKLTRDGLTVNADPTGGFAVVNTKIPGPGPEPTPEPDQPTRPGFLPQTGVGWALSGLAVVGVGALATTGLAKVINRRKRDDEESGADES